MDMSNNGSDNNVGSIEKISQTSDKNVAKVEEDVKRCNELTKVEHANWIGISNQLAISHILAEREQDKKRIQELEEESRKKSIELICYQEELENSIPTQVVMDKIEKNKGYLEYADTMYEYTQKDVIEECIKTLQELLEGERK